MVRIVFFFITYEKLKGPLNCRKLDWTYALAFNPFKLYFRMNAKKISRRKFLSTLKDVTFVIFLFVMLSSRLNEECKDP